MSDVLSTIGKILGLCFAAVVILYTSLLTWQLAGRIIPGNPIAQAMTLILFDVAALVWFILFLTQAKGTLQWAIAGIGFVIGLVGAIIMAGGELVLGQQLIKIDDPTKIGWLLIVTVVVAALSHASLSYLFHFADPNVRGRIENSQEVSKAVERAYKDARAEIARDVDSLVEGLRESVLYEAKKQIESSTAMHLRNANRLEEKTNSTLRGDVIEGQAKDVTENHNDEDHEGIDKPVAVDPALLAAIIAALTPESGEPATPSSNGHRVYNAETEVASNSEDFLSK